MAWRMSRQASNPVMANSRGSEKEMGRLLGPHMQVEGRTVAGLARHSAALERKPSPAEFRRRICGYGPITRLRADAWTISVPRTDTTAIR